MRHAGPEVWRPAGLLQLGGEPFELAAADVLEIAPRRGRRGFFVQEHRQRVPRRHRRGDVLGQGDAVGHRHALNRHEWDHVDGAEPRMLALMLAQSRCA